MAENKESTATSQAKPTPRSASPREVYARRLRNVQDNGGMTPKMRRQFDRMQANIAKGKK